MEQRPIGFHIRIHHDLLDVVKFIQDVNVSVAQSFLITEQNEYVPVSNHMINEFTKAKKELGFLYYVHAAYWSGVTDRKSKMFQSLKKETEFAQDLHADGIIVHPGATRVGIANKDKVYYVAECVNLLHEAYPNIQLLLENGPHAGRTFGGNLEHFALLIDHVERKDLLGFCIDTAHAFVYGYDLVNDRKRHDFLQMLQDMLGADYIKLLHFNDAKDPCGSYIDKHEIPGKGLIGKKVLQDIMNNALFSNIPLVMECSKECDDDIVSLIKEVSNW